MFVARAPRITSNLPSELGQIGENEIVLHQTKCKGRREEIICNPKLEV